MENKRVNLRPHHFFDIIRAFGKESLALAEGKDGGIKPHPYQHSFHKIAEIIRISPDLKIKIVVKCDSVCEGCIHCKSGRCDDRINYRKDFASKEKLNDYADKRIMEKCLIKEGEALTPAQLCQKAGLYLDNIDFIYSGNDSWHTKRRKEDVIEGLNYYSKLHKFVLR
ncbi:DUF1284 domain-containing protein [Patescibacteria group bacterium]|nr:DUF1284 domain-containing protein [Patescibacteria group bacterium]